MNFASVCDQFEWVRYSDQMDSGVTYLYVLNKTIPRLLGDSDILYIGKTEQPIRVRFEQETRTRNSLKNTQQTNIRTTYIFGRLGLENIHCYYVRSLTVRLNTVERKAFLDKLKIWDKRTYLALAENPEDPLLEKYLLVRYAADHLEVPPLNNRM